MALVNRGLAQQNKGELELALHDYDQPLKLNPQLAVAYNNRGVTHKTMGEIKQAIADYSKAIELRPGFGLA